MFRPSFAVFLLIGAGVATVQPIRGQAEAPTPKWEVVSVKPCVARGGVSDTQGPGRIALPCAPVEVFIHQSYLLFPNGKLDLAGAKTRVEKGPAWMYSDLYAIEAKAEIVPGQPAPGQGTMQGPMLRALLADRFKLQVHRETRLVPVYALTVGKDGPKLQMTSEGSCVGQNMDQPLIPLAPGQTRIPFCGLPVGTGLDFRGVTMTELCSWLSLRADRKVVDRTAIAGMFDIRLDLAAAGLAAPPPPPPPGGPPPLRGDSPMATPDPGEVTAQIQSALQKFGLRLEPTQGPDDALIVDHVERPSEN